MRNVLVGVWLATLLVLSLLAVDVGQVWGQSFNPNPPIAGQSFTISGSCSSAPCVVIVIHQTGLGCGNGNTVAVLGPFNGMHGGPGSYSATVLGQPPGSYSTFTFGGESCVFFTIVPATGPTRFDCVPCQESRGKSFQYDGKLNTDDA